MGFDPWVKKITGGGNNNQLSILAWRTPWTKEPGWATGVGKGQAWLSTYIVDTELLFLAAKTHRSTGISEDPKFHKFHKDISRLHAHCLQDTRDPKSPRLSLEWDKIKKQTLWGVSATKGKADGVIEAFNEDHC